MRRQGRLPMCSTLLGVVVGVLAGMLAGVAPARAQAPQQDETAAISEGELRLRVELLQRSMRSGGPFGPALQDWLSAPSAPAAGSNRCSRYTASAARQACGVGDLWAADRLEQDRASGGGRKR
jgi:hypothetical protein